MELMDENNEIDKTMTLMDLNIKCLVEICKYLDVIDQIALQIAYPNEFNIPLNLYYEMKKSLIWDANQFDINHKFYNYLTPDIQYNFIQQISKNLEKFEITPNVTTGFDLDLIEIIIRNCQNLIEIRFLGYATKLDDILDGGGDNLLFSPEIYYEIVENLKNLQLLELCCLFVTDDDILILTGIEMLEHLILHGNEKITGKYLNKFEKLQSININPGDNLNEDNLIEIFKECPDLKLIDISDSDKFNDTLANCCLENCKNLEELFISLSDNLTFTGLEQIAQLEKLKIINLVISVNDSTSEHNEKCSYLLDKMLENGLENQLEKFMTIGIGFPLIFDVLSKFTKLNTLLVRHKEDLHDDTIWERLKNLPDLENLIVTLKLRFLNQEFFDFIQNSYNISKITIIVPKSISNDSETEVEPEIEIEPSAPEADEVFEDEPTVEAVLDIEEMACDPEIDTEICVEAEENEEPLLQVDGEDQPEIETAEAVEEPENAEEPEEDKTEVAEEPEADIKEPEADEENTEADAEEPEENVVEEPEVEQTEVVEDDGAEIATAEETETEAAKDPATEIIEAEEINTEAEPDDVEVAEELDGEALLLPTLDVEPPDLDILDESFIENIIKALKNRNDSVPIKSPVELCIMLQTTLPEKDNILNDPTYVDNKSLLDLIILDK